MEISSPSFEHNTSMPAKYTCQGEDINPPLVISGIPEGTQSLVLIMDDPDAPRATWDHWIVFNMAPLARIDEDSVPAGIQGRNSWGRNDYGGPCPPSGTHRYFFKLYALDAVLDLPPGTPKRAVEKAMKPHLIASAELIGLYEKH